MSSQHVCMCGAVEYVSRYACQCLNSDSWTACNMTVSARVCVYVCGVCVGGKESQRQRIDTNLPKPHYSFIQTLSSRTAHQ